MKLISLSESPKKASHSHPRLNPNYREEHAGKPDLGTCDRGITPQQLPLPVVARPIAELVCEKWRAILHTKPPQPKGKK